MFIGRAVEAIGLMVQSCEFWYGRCNGPRIAETPDQ
jgi:hypothetical protein